MSTQTLTELFDAHASDIYRYAARRAGTSAAEEVLSQTFLVAVEKIEDFDPRRGSPRGWLFGIAQNMLRKHARDEAKQLGLYGRASLAVAAPQDDEASIAARLDANVRGREASAIIAQLPPEERDVLLLFAWAELSYPEIASALDIPVGTVRSRLHRVRRTLRAALPSNDLLKETS